MTGCSWFNTVHISAFAVACALLGTAAAHAAEVPPNILFILIDDMGWADVGCNGSTLYDTPNIDRIAREGMRFTDAYAACPVCSPTRASILTGQYPARLQLTNFLKGERTREGSPILPALYGDYLPKSIVTLADVLPAAGYTSGHVGKWHLSDKRGPHDDSPEDQGFAVNIGGTNAGAPKSYFWPQWGENPPIVGRFEGEFLTDRLSEEACGFMEAHQHRPFFLYMAHYAVHIPIISKPEKIARYEQKLAEHPPAPGEQDNPYYAALVESADESVGRVLATLDRLKLANRTIVVFFSDNGGLSTPEGRHTPATTNAPLRAGKGYLYEGGIRVPCLVRWPGVIPAGTVCHEPIISTDFFPTFCVAAGLDAAAGTLDGVNLLPLLKDPGAQLPERPLYWHYPHFSNQGGDPGAAMRLGDWKLIERYEDGELELYNLADDLGEQHNLATAQPERAAQMQQALAEWRRAVNANMPRPNPAYQP